MPLLSRIGAAAARAYGFLSSAAAAVDQYFNYVTALLHGDGTNGAQNNTFLDSSTNNFTITRNGNTTQGSFSPFSQTGWSNYFSTNSLSATDSSNLLDLGGAAASIEMFVYPTAGGTQVIFGKHGGSSSWSTASGFEYQIQYVSNIFNFIYNSAGSPVTVTDSVSRPANQWYYIAVATNASNNISFYINGNRVATATNAITKPIGRTSILVGNDLNNNYTVAYVSNLRFITGANAINPTSTSITVPTTALTAVSGTQLLTCQSNRFVDNSSNAFAITVTGSPVVQPFSPFNPTSAWSASSNGGSGYFDGSGDYLTVSSGTSTQWGTGDYYIEVWYYPISPTVNVDTIISTTTLDGASNPCVNINVDPADYKVRLGNLYATSNTVTKNAWNWIVVSRVSGTVRIWINGVLGSTNADSTNLNNNSGMFIGNRFAGGQNYTIGQCYIANAKLLGGSGVTSVTMPTAPPTGGNILVNFINGGIYDNAAVADYETVGNAQISTSVKKYGTGSIAFDGTGDYLTSSPNQSTLCAFGTGDFTIEFWIYLNTVSGNQATVDLRPSGVNGAYPLIYVSSTSLTYYVSSVSQINGGVLAASTWYHVAVSRVASQTRMFLNGTQVGSTYADTNSYLCGAGAPWVGSFRDGTGQLNGYIDDLRITKGVGRYQYNFTPPTAAFPNIGGTVTPTADPYFNYTTLLLPGNGTNGAQNNTFLDGSTNNFTITRNGNTTQGTFTPFSQTGWSIYKDSGTNFLSVADNAALQMASGDFTIEFWWFPTSLTGYQTPFDKGYTAAGALLIQTGNGDGKPIVYASGSAVITSSVAVIANQWNNVTLVRSGTSLVLYINGTSVGSATNSTNFNSTATVGIGCNPVASAGTYFPIIGYMSNVRVVKGTAVYTANFTPSTTPLTAITNTSLLTCQSNRFVDNSSNGFAVSVTGTVSVQAFSPFAPTAAYGTSTVGGSGYFDGSGDYLQNTSITNQFDVGSAFTLELWVYVTTYQEAGWVNVGGSTVNWSTSTGLYWSLYQFSGTLYWQTGNGSGSAISMITTTSPSAGAWHHVAIGYNGTTTRMWIDGASVGTSTTAYSKPSGTDRVQVGAFTGGTAPFAGYMSGVRFVKGTDVYGVGNTTITIPTAPLTAISGTSLLLNYTNAGITDSTAKNDLETQGNAQISTTSSKFGGSSIKFPGASGDALTIPYSQAFNFGTGDFTVECWANISYVQYSAIISSTAVTITSAMWLLGYSNTANQMAFGIDSGGVAVIGADYTAYAGTWTHIAVTRYGSTLRMFFNGIQVASVSNSTNFTGTTTSPVKLGARYVDSALYQLNGYIDDLRITKGIARYTSNFTPPTTAFLGQ